MQERSMREEMRLNGRSKQTVDRLLSESVITIMTKQSCLKILLLMVQVTICLKSQGNWPRKNIKRSVESLVDSLKKRKSYGRNQNISEFNIKKIFLEN